MISDRYLKTCFLKSWFYLSLEPQSLVSVLDNCVLDPGQDIAVMCAKLTGVINIDYLYIL